MAKIDIAKVLAMSKDEQKLWCLDNIEIVKGDYSLADLAFRLRDEVETIGKMHLGIKAVCDKLSLAKPYIEWWTYEAQPIHWILSSLLAKEHGNENRSKKV